MKIRQLILVAWALWQAVKQLRVSWAFFGHAVVFSILATAAWLGACAQHPFALGFAVAWELQSCCYELHRANAYTVWRLG